MACGLTALTAGAAPAPASAAGDCTIQLTSPASAAELSRGEDIDWKASGTDNGWGPNADITITTEMPMLPGLPSFVDTYPYVLDGDGAVTGGFYNISEFGNYVVTISVEDGCSATLTVTVAPWPGVPHGCSWENVLARNDTAKVTAGRWTKIDVLANDDVCRQYMVVSVVAADRSLRHRVNADNTISVRAPRPGKTLHLTYTFQITGTDPDYHLDPPATLTVRSKRKPGAGHQSPTGPKTSPGTSTPSASSPKAPPAPATIASLLAPGRAGAAGPILGGFVTLTLI